jgi:SAM-dependent methyltransferase
VQHRFRRWFRHLGWDQRNWLRIRQIEAFTSFLTQRSPMGRVLEISPGWNEMWKRLAGPENYTAVEYPDYDVSRDVLPAQYDVVIADQVLEHVARPLQAMRHIHAMVAPGGHALVAVPFLFRVHARPHDYYRWTAAGLRELLLEAGFHASEIHVDSWGNKACVRAHIGGPVRDYGLWRDLSNDPEYPIMSWGFARKPAVPVP